MAALFFDAFVPISPYLLLPWRIDSRMLQSALAIGMGAYAVSQFVAAYWLPRFNLARVHAVAALLVAALALSLQLNLGWPFRAALILLLFAVNAVAAAAGRALMREVYGQHGFQEMTARLYGALEVMEVLAPLVLVMIASRLGWRWPLLLLGFLLLLVAGFLLLPSKHDGQRATCQLVNVACVLHDANFIRPTLAMAAIQALFSALLIAKPIVLVQDYGFGDQALAMVLSGLALAMLPGFALAARLGRRISTLYQWRICQSLLLSCCVLLAIAVLSGSSACYISACVFCSWAFCIGLPLCSALVMSQPVEHRTVASALFGCAQGVGAAMLMLAALVGPGLRPFGQLVIGVVATSICFGLGRLDCDQVAQDAAAQ